MTDGPGDAEQTTLAAFAEPSVHADPTAAADRKRRDVDGERCVDEGRLESLDERVRELEQLVPGVDGKGVDWEHLDRSEKTATILARLVRLKIHVAGALPDDEPRGADRGFE